MTAVMKCDLVNNYTFDEKLTLLIKVLMQLCIKNVIIYQIRLHNNSNKHS